MGVNLVMSGEFYHAPDAVRGARTATPWPAPMAMAML